MNIFMFAATLPPPVQAYAPDFAGRFAIILKGLIDLIARLAVPTINPLAQDGNPVL